MTIRKAHIFDAVKRAGRDGIGGGDLRSIFSPPYTMSCLKSHIWQINELIADTGYTIRSKYRTYCLIRGS